MTLQLLGGIAVKQFLRSRRWMRLALTESSKGLNCFASENGPRAGTDFARYPDGTDFANARSGGMKAAGLRQGTSVDQSLELPPERKLINSRSEYNEAVGMLLPLAQRELRVFDPDLAALGLHTEERCAQLRQFLRRSRNNRLYIALHDVDFVSRRAPRLISLLGTFSSSMFIHRTEGDAARVQDCFVLCDELHLVRRRVAAQPRGALYLNDPREGLETRERFDAIWENSLLAVSATQIGL